jgi:hypothetical protein
MPIGAKAQGKNYATGLSAWHNPSDTGLMSGPKGSPRGSGGPVREAARKPEPKDKLDVGGGCGNEASRVAVLRADERT